MATIRTTFQFKRGLSADLERVNPIIAPGEPVWAVDTGVLKIGSSEEKTWNELKAISDLRINSEDVEAAVNKYLEEHPITIETDATLSVAGLPADAAAVRKNCVFKTDSLILKAGDADDNIFE